jgi:hypothetical protein
MRFFREFLDFDQCAGERVIERILAAHKSVLGAVSAKMGAGR